MMQNCCGMRLRTAGIVLGWLGIASSLFGVVLFGVLLVYRESFVNIIVDSFENSETTDSKDELKPRIELVLTIGLSVELAACLINGVASSLLLAGTIMERHMMLVPWLINYAFWFVISLIYNMSYMAMYPSAAIFISIILSTALSCWIFEAIFSLYRQMKRAAEEKLTDRYVQFGAVEKTPGAYVK